MIFMRKALIWNMQCKVYGCLAGDQKRALKAAADGKVNQAQSSHVRAGAQLVRESNGRRYQIEVIEDGFRMNGETFKSLSAVALHITGTSWSGPRFFGLTAPVGTGK